MIKLFLKNTQLFHVATLHVELRGMSIIGSKSVTITVIINEVNYLLGLREKQNIGSNHHHPTCFGKQKTIHQFYREYILAITICFYFIRDICQLIYSIR